ncbi:TlpA family protein disulfide reductase [Mucilaginibacter sp.]|uniref:TlpA family protein disulfide reductase n=1 Tax=Mucilaginibacter sp. TaxID=1882438 RepID=UPI0035BC26FB
MKKYFLLIVILSAVIASGNAQTDATTKHITSNTGGFKPTPIDEDTIVKDANGKELAYNEWHPLLQTGEYSIRSIQVTNQKPSYSLVRLTDSEKQYWAEKRKAALANLPNAGVNVSGDTQASATSITPPPPADENTVVKDSTGIVYPYAVWQAMMRTNNYNLRWFKKSNADAAVYTITKKTQAEKDAWMARMPKPAQSDFFKEGDNFSYFNEKDLTGERLNAKTLAGKILVLNFWFIGCPPCRAEIPDLNAIAAQYKDNKNVVFVAIALDQGYEVKDFTKSTPFNYHLAYDGRFTANKYGIKSYPTNVIINKEGKVVYSSMGNYINNSFWIKKTINEILAAN